MFGKKREKHPLYPQNLLQALLKDTIFLSLYGDQCEVRIALFLARHGSGLTSEEKVRKGNQRPVLLRTV